MTFGELTSCGDLPDQHCHSQLTWIDQYFTHQSKPYEYTQSNGQISERSPIIISTFEYRLQTVFVGCKSTQMERLKGKYRQHHATSCLSCELHRGPGKLSPFEVRPVGASAQVSIFEPYVSILRRDNDGQLYFELHNSILLFGVQSQTSDQKKT